MSGLVVYTAPAVEPITSTEAKLFARIDTSDDDTLVTSLIVAARQAAELYTGRTFVDTVYDYTLNYSEVIALGTGPLTLPTSPLDSVTSITYYDEDGDASTFSATSYNADTASAPSRIYLDTGVTWPSGLRDYNSMVVRFKAGYSADATSVPDAVKTAIKMMVTDLYEHREDEMIGTNTVKIKLGARALLDTVKVWGFWV